MACVLVFPSLLNIHVFVAAKLMFLVLTVCLAGVVEAVFQHAAVNETIRCALVSGGVPAVLEPVGIIHDDGKRLDGMSLIPRSWGLPLLWDFTCSDTLVPSNLSASASGAIQLANAAESAKDQEVFFSNSIISLLPCVC